MRRYPDWVLAVVVPMWSGIALGAAWLATRLGNRVAGCIVAALLAWALTFNLTALPYTLWFKIAMFSFFPVACLLGIRWGHRPTPAPR